MLALLMTGLSVALTFVLGLVLFALHFAALTLGWGPNRDRPALFKTLFRLETAGSPMKARQA